MSLYTVTAKGVQAFCSDVVLDPYNLDTVYFMSICGYQETVKGIIANLLENYGISVDIEGVEYYLTRSVFGYKALLKKLPSGLAHALLFPKLALPKNDLECQNSFYIFTQQKGEPLSLFYRHLDDKTEIPLHPSWDAWLWKLFEEQETWLVELKTLVGAYRGYSFEFIPKELHDLISTAIRIGVPEIIKCMEWRGGDGDGTLDIAQGFSG